MLTVTVDSRLHPSAIRLFFRATVYYYYYYYYTTTTTTTVGTQNIQSCI
jgi:hypothetical protein